MRGPTSRFDAFDTDGRTSRKGGKQLCRAADGRQTVGLTSLGKKAFVPSGVVHFFNCSSLATFEKIEKHNPAAMDSIDIDTLKRSCKANGLSDAGTKAELWTRLKGGSGGDKKKAKKAAAPAADAGPPPSYVAK